MALWRRRLVLGGGAILLGQALWSLAILATVRTAVGPVLPRLFAGARSTVVTLMATRRLAATSSSGVPITAALAVVATAVGLSTIGAVPDRLRSGGLRWAVRAVRTAAAATITLTLAAGPLGAWRDVLPVDWSRAALRWGLYATAAQWAATGWLLAGACAAAGRPALAARVAGVFAVAAVTAAVVGTQYGGPWFAWPWPVRAYIAYADAAAGAAATVLAGRFAAVSGVWSRDRWWAWAGLARDPDAQRR